MKRILVPIFVVMFVFSTTCLQARNHFNERDEDKNHYTWNPTNESQERQAVGMVIWGFSIAIAALIISVIVPNSTSPTAGTGTKAGGDAPATGGNNLT